MDHLSLPERAADSERDDLASKITVEGEEIEVPCVPVQLVDSNGVKHDLMQPIVGEPHFRVCYMLAVLSLQESEDEE